jgi:hypothetical protein
MRVRRPRCRLVAVLFPALLASCGGGARQTPAAPAPATPAPSATATETIGRNGYTLVVTNLDPAVPQSTLGSMIDCFFAVYPPMAARFNPGARRSVSLTIDPNRSGVAATAGGVITVASAWMKAHPTDVDLVTHEAFHVVQAYPSGGRPSWAVEGLADYARDRYGVGNALAGWSLPSYSPTQNYTDSYRVTARFFKWMEARVHPRILDELDSALRSAPYTETFWVRQSGKTIDQLWSDYGADPRL